MLNKRIPYHAIVMSRASAEPPLPAPELLEGYAFKMYEAGDEEAWAAVEASVHEFSNAQEALRYFKTIFAPYQTLLKQRMVFVVDAKNNYVATATAWVGKDENIGVFPQLHWVSVHPEHQRLGLGRAVVVKAMSIFESIGPSGDVWLTTQTWSHHAVSLYVDLGFCIRKKSTINKHSNDFVPACGVLQSVLAPHVYDQLMMRALE